MLTGRVLVTGGTGFLARGIYRRARREGWGAVFTCFSRGEYAQESLAYQYPEVRRVIGDVRDAARLRDIMMGHDIVLHAAAMKRIPEGEQEPSEVVKTNVIGIFNVIEAAKAAGIRSVIGISTDKACRPLNGYGISKAIGERLFAEAGYQSARSGGPRFQTVRYGNVVGSTGSVIPLFQRQMRDQGYVTLTVPTMTRFWMPVDQAIDSILFALEPGRIAGSVTIPRPKAMQMGALAAALAGEAVKVIGPRPGEKEHEELMHASESAYLLKPLGSHYELLSRAFTRQPDLALLETGWGPLEAPITLASHSPAGGWVTPEQMLAWIEDARDV